MSTPAGVRLADCSPATIESEVTKLVAELRDGIATQDSLLLVTDAYYPHHESTGLVTNPAVVEALCEAFASLGDQLRVLPAVGDRANATMVIEALGYDDIATSTGASVVSPEECSIAERSVPRPEAESDRLDVSLPTPLLDAAVVVVPTLRSGLDDGIAPTLRPLESLVSFVDGPQNAPRAALATVADDIVEPELAVLDGTYAFVDRPHRSRFLVGTTDRESLDEIGSYLLGSDRSAVASHAIPGDTPYVEGLSAAAIGRELSEESSTIERLLPTDPATDSEDDGLTERAYRAYAQLAGDILPPQVQTDRSS